MSSHLKSMRLEIESLCIQYITDEWNKLRPVKREPEPPILPPWGVWICSHGPVSRRMELFDIETIETEGVRKVWFLDKRGIRSRDVWEYARFFVVNFVRPWASCRVDPVEPEALLGPYYFQIGIAHFAEFYDADGVYVATSWGSLYGQGYHMKIGATGKLQVERMLWLS